MALPPRSISSIRRYVRLVAFGAAGLCSCEIFTDVPLKNNRPHLVSTAQTITKTLFYPDSIACTLAIEDLNDEKLSVNACYTDSGDTSCPAAFSPWKGSCRWLQEELGVKQAVLTVDSRRLCRYHGHLHIADPEGAEVKIPFSFERCLIDPLDRFPLNHTLWTCEPKHDSGFISFDSNNKKLMFFFGATNDSSGASTGIRSLFRVSGDFSISVDLELQYGMRNGFQIAFFLSTNPDANPWHPTKTGFFIEGFETHTQLTYRSVDIQTYSKDLLYIPGQTAGKLSIFRTKGFVKSSFRPVDTNCQPVPVDKFLFPADSAVYIHLRMNVDDRLRIRNCSWSDFMVSKGTIVH